MENREKIREQGRIKSRRYKKLNPEKYRRINREYAQRKTLKDPSYKINASIRSGIYTSLRGLKNGKKWRDLVGYSLEELKQHLQSKFKNRMAWDNYGIYWHIDHIIPVSLWKFTKSKDREFKQCWSLANLQPLTATENLRKHTSINFQKRIF